MADRTVIWMNDAGNVRIVAIVHEPRSQEEAGYTELRVEAYKKWERQEYGALREALLPEHALRELLVQAGLLADDD